MIDPPVATMTTRPLAVIPPGSIRPFRALAWAVAALTALFAPGLMALGQFALTSPLYSYIPLIPVISLYIVWSRRNRLPARTPPFRVPALLLFAGVGVALLASWRSPPNGELVFTTLAFTLAVAGTCAWLGGRALFRALAFPLAFLVFIIPIPTGLLTVLESLMQHGSAAVAHVLFQFAGTPVFYQELHFQLPGIVLHVAPECSGMRSTLVLLIVSVLTSHLFLRTFTASLLVSMAVLPLALVRNGFRIFTIGELCTHIGPEMIDSLIHRQGGPIFFVLSLAPFLLLVALLSRWERRTLGARGTPPAAISPTAAHP